MASVVSNTGTKLRKVERKTKKSFLFLPKRSNFSKEKEKITQNKRKKQFFSKKILSEEKKAVPLRPVSKVLSFEITKKNTFLFGYLLTYSYLCTRF